MCSTLTVSHEMLTFPWNPHHSHFSWITGHSQVDLKYSQRSTIRKREQITGCSQLCCVSIFVAEILENTISSHVEYFDYLFTETLFPSGPFVDIKEVQIMFGVVVFRTIQADKVFLVRFLDVAPCDRYLATILNGARCYFEDCWLGVPSCYLGDELVRNILVVCITSSIDEIAIGI